MSDRFPLNQEALEPREGVVITALRRIYEEEGDPSSCPELIAFVTAREAEANRADSDRANLETSILMATIYARSGYVEEAHEQLSQTREAARQRNELDLVERIDGLLDRLEAFLDNSPTDPETEE